MKINVKKGLFRIYAIWDISILISLAISHSEITYIYRNNPENILLFLAPIIAPWILHYLVKWVIKGFQS